MNSERQSGRRLSNHRLDLYWHELRKKIRCAFVIFRRLFPKNVVLHILVRNENRPSLQKLLCKHWAWWKTPRLDLEYSIGRFQSVIWYAYWYVLQNRIGAYRESCNAVLVRSGSESKITRSECDEFPISVRLVTLRYAMNSQQQLEKKDTVVACETITVLCCGLLC